ncbi:hypothetical protein [Methanosarcina horonobensis]|nr:hypothetical protein [Methanosarcina horonobensis]
MSVLLSTFSDMEFDRPLYCFTLPGFILVAGGLYINLNSVQAFYPDGSLSLESTVVILLLPFIGIFMAFIGILMHSITGLIRYKMNNQNK